MRELNKYYSIECVYEEGVSMDITIEKLFDSDDINVLYFIPNLSGIERDLHKEFSSLNKIIKGTKGVKHREWFLKHPSIINKFNNLCQQKK